MTLVFSQVDVLFYLVTYRITVTKKVFHLLLDIGLEWKTGTKTFQQNSIV
jgi:hypothetical protein